MKIQTSKAKMFDAIWFGKTLSTNEVYGEIIPPFGITCLSDIAIDFENLEYIDRYDDSEGYQRMPVKPNIRSISWTDRNTIQLGFRGEQA